jgi:hypothetical protein
MVPTEFRQTGVFVAALIPWTMTPAEYSSQFIHSSLVSFAPPDFNTTTSQAIRVLEFPDNLLTNHPYCVWASPGDGTASAPGLETQLLHNIMTARRAKKLRHDDPNVRRVFIHVVALETLYGSPDIMKMRGEQPKVRFYTYGSHPRIPRQQCGVHEIYPLGKLPLFFSRFLLLILVKVVLLYLLPVH